MVWIWNAFAFVAVVGTAGFGAMKYAQHGVARLLMVVGAALLGAWLYLLLGIDEIAKAFSVTPTAHMWAPVATGVAALACGLIVIQGEKRKGDRVALVAKWRALQPGTMQDKIMLLEPPLDWRPPDGTP